MSGSKGFKRQNLKDIKELNLKKKEKNSDLSNVNHHLTHIVTINSNTVILPAAGQGWRGNLIKGSPVTKTPLLMPTCSGRSLETKW